MPALNSLRNELHAIIQEAQWVFKSLTPAQSKRLAWTMLLMAVAAAANAAGPIIIGATVDDIFAGKVNTLLSATPWLLLLASAYVFREAITVTRRILVERAATDVERSTLLRAVGATFRAELSVVAADRVGTAHSRIRRSVDGVVRYVKLGFLDFVPAVANAIFAIGTAFITQPLMGGLLVLIVPAGGYIVLRQLASQRGVRLRLNATREIMDGTIVEQLTGQESVRAANAIDREITRTDVVASQLQSDEMSHHKAMAAFDALKSLNEAFFHVVLLTLAIVLNMRGLISSGDVLAFSLLYMAAVAPLREIHRILDEAHESSMLVRQLRTILERPADISFETPDLSWPLRDANIVIAAGHVSAGYLDAGGGRSVLQNVSFEIRRGEVVGIAGASGCGKSTAIRAILRLLHPSGGVLNIYGVPVNAVSRKMIAETFAYVGQLPFLFAGTIRDNILWEKPDATDDEIRAAAEAACIRGEIERMPGGFDAPVAEGGSNLAGGQRQRIALARAFLKQARILVLDEATSALDTITESIVLNSVRAQKTDVVLMVAHRILSLRATDRILVFDHGTVVESGPFQELAASGGCFTRLLHAAGRDDTDPRAGQVALALQTQSLHSVATP